MRDELSKPVLIDNDVQYTIPDKVAPLVYVSSTESMPVMFYDWSERRFDYIKVENDKACFCKSRYDFKSYVPRKCRWMNNEQLARYGPCPRKESVSSGSSASASTA